MNMDMMGAGDSLDDIIMQNTRDLQQRQNYSTNPYATNTHNDGRRPSMLQFGSHHVQLDDFQFGQSAPNGQNMDNGDDQQNGMGFGTMSDPMSFNDQNAFNPMQLNAGLSMDSSNNFDLATDMMGNMINYSGMENETCLDNLFVPNYASQYSTNMPDFTMSGVLDNNLTSQDLSNTNVGPPRNDSMPRLKTSTSNSNSNSESVGPSVAQPTQQYSNPSTQGDQPRSRRQSLVRRASNISLDPEQKAVVAAGTEAGQLKSSSFGNVYSSSGFDMLGALMRVATRKNPQIDIGAVDLSCAFAVCDVTQNDCPIVYVSEIFERLTGYNKHEVLGRNCRFLQSPDGKVTPGVKRKYVDDDSVYYIKTRIKANQEAQRSLINYRKGGQPFMNLLTMIPIPWDDPNEIRYIVGFQVDLVEQPSSVAGKSQGGSYTVNYRQGELPRYIWQPPDTTRNPQESGQSISRDDVSQILQTFNSSSDSEITKRLWDKVLLENTDDVVHVLSLKGLFLYLSPSARNVLEYDSSELVGTALSSICHPSDIVPVTRELKDTSTGATVNVVFRIRRKRSGYTWFEAHGSLCVDQGKGRKCIILVGRERPVYALSRYDIESTGGIGENEMWSKLSTSGMVLFISSNTRILLDRQPDDLVGTSVQALMRQESQLEFGRILERARTGKRVNFKHELFNKRGQILQAHTTLYPGDASEGSKPTFLVAQIRLVKSPSRSAGSSTTSNTFSRNALQRQSSIDSQKGGHDNALLLSPRSTTSSSKEYTMTQAGSAGLQIGTQDVALASEDNIFDELKTTRCTSWQFELRQMEKSNRLLAEELASLLSSKKKRKRRKGAGQLQKDCANCHVKATPEWRRGPSGNRDLCNSCGLRWAKQVSTGCADGRSFLSNPPSFSPSSSEESLLYTGT